MRSRFLNWPMLALGGIVLAAAVFGGGLLAGKALDDGESQPASPDDSLVGPARNSPFTGQGNPAANFATRPANAGAGMAGEDDGAESAAADIARGGGYAPGIPSSYYGCEALLGDVIQNGSLDPASAGITPRLLGPAYQLIRLSVWAEGDCEDSGQTTGVGKPVLESQWRHVETGVSISLAQRVLGEPVANVRYDTSATVVADGYLFVVSGWNNYYYEDARDLPAPADGDDAGDDVGAASIVPPSDQENVAPVIEAVLAEIAPGVPGTCYYTQTEGDWSDLAAFGVGDPRSAVPAGFTESSFNFYTFTPPASSCETNGAEPPTGNSFWVQWTGDGGSSYLEVNVYRDQYAETESWPGNLDEWGANWTRNGYSFGVWGSGANGGVGADVIEAVAHALDPQFNAQCLIRLTPLDSSALAEVGLSAPSAEGWEIVSSDLNRRGIDPSCPNAGQEYTNYEMHWTLESDDGYVEVHGWISGTNNGGGERWGYIYQEGLEWGHGNRNFNIWGKGIGDEAFRDTLIQIATSIDPEFNIDDLSEEGMPRPLPVDIGATEGGQAAEDAAAAAESSAR